MPAKAPDITRIIEKQRYRRIKYREKIQSLELEINNLNERVCRLENDKISEKMRYSIIRHAWVMHLRNFHGRDVKIVDGKIIGARKWV